MTQHLLCQPDQLPLVHLFITKIVRLFHTDFFKSFFLWSLASYWSDGFDENTSCHKWLAVSWYSGWSGFPSTLYIKRVIRWSYSIIMFPKDSFIAFCWLWPWVFGQELVVRWCCLQSKTTKE
jgi:hypothetical protein